MLLVTDVFFLYLLLLCRNIFIFRAFSVNWLSVPLHNEFLLYFCDETGACLFLYQQLSFIILSWKGNLLQILIYMGQSSCRHVLINLAWLMVPLQSVQCVCPHCGMDCVEIYIYIYIYILFIILSLLFVSILLTSNFRLSVSLFLKYISVSSPTLWLCVSHYSQNTEIASLRREIMHIQARSRNYFWRGKAISITYSECVYVVLVTQRAKRMRRVILSLVASPVVQHFSTLS
jgi:hypothetical protein